MAMSTPLAILVALVALTAFVAVAYRRRWQWTGLPAHDDNGVRQPPKTLWDWLQLLVIPVALAILVALFSSLQTKRDQRREDQRIAREDRIAEAQVRLDQQREDRRIDEERALNADADRQRILDDYLAQLSHLLLQERLAQARLGAEVLDVARTATLTAVSRLDGARRGQVIRALDEAGVLFHLDSSGGPQPLNLTDADLSEADLHGAVLTSVTLNGANLTRAILDHAAIPFAQLINADLRRADLSFTYIRYSDLSGANLMGADLAGADLTAANVSGADLSGADLSGADLSGADLSRANLTGANLSGANLRLADLQGSLGGNLSDAVGTPRRGP